MAKPSNGAKSLAVRPTAVRKSKSESSPTKAVRSPAKKAASKPTRKKVSKPAVDPATETRRLLRKRPEVTSYDTYGYAAETEEDFFVVPERGRDYGRCGGRAIQSLMERCICDRLSRLGVAHSHRPRRYEVKINGGQIAAYSPCFVLRGRGREGKTAIIEVLAHLDELHIAKVQAFRQLYDSEFYVIFAAPGLVFDDMPSSAYDEAVLPSEVASLVARLAE